MISFSLQLDCNPPAHHWTSLVKDKIRRTFFTYFSCHESIHFRRIIWKVYEWKEHFINRDHTNEGWGITGKQKHHSASTEHPREQGKAALIAVWSPFSGT